MQVSTALLATEATVFLEHHVWRALLAIAEQHAPPVLWDMSSMLEHAPSALQPHVFAAISPQLPYALSATAPLTSIPARIYVFPALVLAAAAKPQQSAQTVSMVTSCKPSTT